MEKQFLNYIQNAQRILITSHVSPDPDAVCSALLLGNTLKANFKDKIISISLEEKPDSLDYLEGYSQIQFSELGQLIKENHPGLLIVVDAPNLQRCTRLDIDLVKKQLEELGTRIVLIDHHQPETGDKLDLTINKGRPAATQEVYELCFDELKFSKPSGYAETTLLGIYSDTGGFIYKANRPRQMFELVSELVESGVSLESIKNRLESYTPDHLKVIAELANNVSGTKDYTYSYISDEFYEKWQKNNKLANVLHTGCKKFVDSYIRNIDGRQWGFIVFRNSLLEANMYSVSFRSTNGVVDVSQIAKKMSGGGHKPAAAGRVAAGSAKEAITQVQSIIKD